MPFVVGETIGPYRILGKFGSGGMATVFKAFHAALDRYVAIKALHPVFMEDPNFLARFQREAQVIAKLEHPNIVPIYDFSEHEGRPYLVMKFIEGETLKAHLSKSHIKKNELLHIVNAVGEGLNYAHDNGILHRDIKPSNVLIGNDQRVYVADFGLARIAQAGESTLSSDMMLGTPQYISPEQAMGVSELDEGTDIYSFGVMLYEISVGQIPFSADTPFSVIHDHIYKPLPIPSHINPEVNEEIERVLLKALAKKREDRYPNAKALANAFVKAIRTPNTVVASVGVEPSDPSGTRVLFRPSKNIGEKAEQEQLVSKESTTDDSQNVIDAKSSQGKIKEPPRKMKKWHIALVVIGLIFCCLMGLVGLSRIRENRQSTENGPVDTRLEEGVIDSGSNLDFDGVMSQVEENPDDPWPHLELLDLRLSDGDLLGAEEEVREIMILGGKDPDLYSATGDLLARYKIWPYAAQFYMRSARLSAEPRGDVVGKIHQAVYKSGSFDGGLEILAHSEPGLDPQMLEILDARYELNFGDPEVASEKIQELVEQEPFLVYEDLLYAEFLIIRAEYQDAEDILERIINDEMNPLWVRTEAGGLLANNN